MGLAHAHAFGLLPLATFSVMRRNNILHPDRLTCDTNNEKKPFPIKQVQPEIKHLMHTRCFNSRPVNPKGWQGRRRGRGLLQRISCNHTCHFRYELTTLNWANKNKKMLVSLYATSPGQAQACQISSRHLEQDQTRQVKPRHA